MPLDFPRIETPSEIDFAREGVNLEAEKEKSFPKWPESKPLQRKIPDSDSFPVEALGDVLGGMASVMSEIIQAPLAICGQSVLAASTLAIQGHANVVIDGRVSPLSEFFVVVGGSGERKSAVDRCALAPHMVYQEHLRQENKKEVKDYHLRLEAYKKTKDEILKKGKGMEGKMGALLELGEEPEAPLLPHLVIEEPTYEGLIKLLTMGQPSLGLFSDEGGRFIGGHGMNQDNMLKTAAGLCGLWDGKPVSRVRAGDGSSLLVGRRLSLHLMLQPNVAEMMLSNGLLLEQGLLSRCLCTYPTSTVGRRFYKEADLSISPEFKKYETFLNHIFHNPLPVGEEKNELAPRELSLSPDPKQLWMAFHDSVEQQLSESGTLASIQGFGNKAPEHAARLAGGLALFDDLQISEISTEHMKNGIALTEYYLNEAIRLFDSGAMDQDLVLAGKLFNWLKAEGKKVITLVEVYQYGPNSIRDATKARMMMNILVQHGLAIPINGGAEFEGKRRSEAWRVRI